MKADGSRLIPRKHTETLVLLSVTQKNASLNLQFFKNLKYKSIQIFWGFDQPSSIITWQVMVENVNHYLVPKAHRTQSAGGLAKSFEGLDSSLAQ